MMAEGLFDGILGGGEPEPLETEATTTVADPIAAAVALDAARFDPELSRKAGDYLDEQRRLVKIQTEHLHEQREDQLSHLKLRRFTDRLKAGTQLFFIMVATVVGLGLGVMVFDAFSARSVIVEPFDAPPALAAQGISGKVVATGVLDVLENLQKTSRSPKKGLATQNAWSSDVKIEAPGTGVSIGEINRLLRDRFGHDLHVKGELVQIAGSGLALTVRGDGVPAQTFSGTALELDKLTTQAAEYVYGRVQPMQFGKYLVNHNRTADALAFFPAAYRRATDDREKAWLMHDWGNAEYFSGHAADGVAKQRLAIKLDPDYWSPRSDVVVQISDAQGEEAGWLAGRAFLDRVANTPRQKQPELRLLNNPANAVWDSPLTLAALLWDEAHYGAGAGTSSGSDDLAIADTYGSMHDWDDAAHYMVAVEPADPATKEEGAILPVYKAIDRGGWAAATPALEAIWTALQATPTQRLKDSNLCYLGLAYGMQGRFSDADAVFKRTGPWSYCYAFHGDILARTGDVAGAKRTWDEGLRVAPDPPIIYLHRGLFELNHSDLSAAQADFRTANLKAPHFADPLKAWGDLLAREGRWNAALVKYDEARKYAPAWLELQRTRTEAAKYAS